MSRRAFRPCLAGVSTAFLLAGCGAPPPRPPPRTAVALPPAEPPQPPPPGPAVLGVTTTAPPVGWVLDGDLGEWGSLAPHPRPRPGGSMPGPGSTFPLQVVPAPAQPPPPPLPRGVLEAASRVAVALSPESILVAGALDDRSLDGVWLGLGTLPAAVPNIGSPARGGSRFDPVACGFVETLQDGTLTRTDERTPPAETAACEALLARHAAFVAAHQERFRTLWHVGREGLRVVTPSGALEPVPGARVAWKETATGRSFEASVPIAAMPRVAEAPVSTLRLVARAATSTVPPSLPPAAWATLHLPAVVSFEPLGALRAAVFGRLSAEPIDEQSPSTFTPYRHPPGLSYHPSDPGHVESLESGSETIAVHTHPLYVKVASLRELEVGRVEVPRAFVAVFRAGRLVDVVDVEDSDSTSAVPRQRELFVYSPISEPWSNESNGALPRWSILAVSPEGQIREAIDIPENDPFTSECWRVAGGQSTAEEGLGTLHSTARCVDVSGAETPITATFRWDAKRRLYRGTHWRPIEND